ncbi:MAG TPA: DnaJ domain-containing protein, partial [Candidatus Sericytochromatia bacterium]
FKYMENLEDKFLSLELDDEIENLKQKLRNLGSQAGENDTTSKSNQESILQLNEKRIRFYAILGLKDDASMKEVKQAYRNLVKKFHPDLFYHNSQLQQKAQEVLMEINEAYDELF